VTSDRKSVSVEQLEASIRSGEIDTVVVAFTDLHGRLVGKRVTGGFWLDHVGQGHGIEACDYLLAVDVDLTPLPGFEFASWDRGYGDVRAVPDLTTIRSAPWLERSAIVLSHVVDVHTGAAVEVSPRRILQCQVERARQLGFDVMVGAEIEFYLFADSYADAAAKGYRSLRVSSASILDYQILATGRDEPVIAAMRSALEGAGVPVEGSKGEAGRGQHEINLRYADAVEMADRCVLYKSIVKEVAAAHGQAATFMAKPMIDESGSSCHIHSSTWSAETGAPLMWDADRQTPSEHFHHYLGGLLAATPDLMLLLAPNLNSYKRFQASSWAPTSVAWGHDNRTCGFRSVATGSSHRIECRIPGADVNPYLAFAAIIAAGVHGVERRLDPGPPLTGNAYQREVPVISRTLVDAADRFERSDMAREAFGPAVHHHLLNLARQEWLAFHEAISDWELRRNFEAI
jgi:glutamine synthetase